MPELQSVVVSKVSLSRTLGVRQLVPAGAKQRLSSKDHIWLRRSATSGVWRGYRIGRAGKQATMDNRAIGGLCLAFSVPPRRVKPWFGRHSGSGRVWRGRDHCNRWEKGRLGGVETWLLPERDHL